jgi:pimeloyl-ACP methyl ester carboxylesterase
LFAVLAAESTPSNDADGIRKIVTEAAAELDAANLAGAARIFIDYWMGTGAFDHMPESRQAPIVGTISNIRGWGEALLNEPTPLTAFAQLNIPVLYMVGKDSPASSRGVARVLTRILPQVEFVEFEGLGHMGPVTHAEVVNEAVYRFLKQV